MNSSNLVYRVRHEQQPQSDLLLKTSYSSSPTPPPAPSSRQQQPHWQIEKRRRRRRSPGSKVSPSCLNVLVVSAPMAFMTAWLYLSTSRRTQPSVRNMRNSPDMHSSIVLLERLERDGSIPPAPPVRSGTPNFGNLQLSFPSVRRSVDGHFDASVIGPEARQILHDTLSSHREDAGTKNETGKDDDALKTYYAFDDDYLRNPYRLWDDDQIKEKRRCRRVSWHRTMYLNCNNFHEFDLPRRMAEGLSRYLGDGAYRNVFGVNIPDTDEHVVFKECGFDDDHTFSYDDYEFMRMDGAVGEIVANHPLFTDTYGFCALSLLSEAMQKGDVDAVAVPLYERCNETFVRQGLDGGVNGMLPFKKMNSLTTAEKLEWSLQMAEAVAVLNNHPGGVIVHDDIQLPQFLLGQDGRLKLNDFNRAEIMLFDEENHEYCRYRNNPGAGDWRAPEEYYDYPLDEKIDVWSLGNNFYALLTGLYPFYDECHSKRIKERVKKGATPIIHPGWKKHGPGESALVDIIRQCWIYNPENRITIGDVVLRLRKAVDDNRRLQSQATRFKINLTN